MWTRSMIAIKKDGEFKVAQYSQWDWYPMWQWLTLLKLLQEIDIKVLSKKVDLVRKITDDEIDAIPDDGKWTEEYPWLSRDCWANIVKYIMEDKHILKIDLIDLEPNIWIEWSYLIDFDKNVFQIYHGTILSWEKYVSKPGHKYRKPIASFPLNELPTEEVWIKKYTKY